MNFCTTIAALCAGSSTSESPPPRKFWWQQKIGTSKIFENASIYMANFVDKNFELCES